MENHAAIDPGKSLKVKHKCCLNCRNKQNSNLEACTNRAKAGAVSTAANKFTRLRQAMENIRFGQQAELPSSVPAITTLLQTILEHEVTDYNFYQNIERLFTLIRLKLSSHLLVEKNVMLSLIEKLLAPYEANVVISTSDINALQTSIGLMKGEHHNISNLLSELQLATNDYQLLPGQSQVQQALMNKLKELSESLLQHIEVDEILIYQNATALLNEPRLYNMPFETSTAIN